MIVLYEFDIVAVAGSSRLARIHERNNRKASRDYELFYLAVVPDDGHLDHPLRTAPLWVSGSGFGVSFSGFRVEGLVLGLGLRVSSFGLRGWGLGFGF